ncbi:hypothetical protein CEUSTIGMA_g6390.t1 [Chlamydomonas eustigma]|uniref:Uncharacterized protein n=1 Tax=Chlamydomonas eustigma TaxID=1157962 RepID=A0A250X862_9CHLO|nr:hypothetical protein CEUSTIGMA_g6390.t1 [Chlamydomonas eustigma]|eukprot:GAX78950.1 hypothetical protein CEUSTIGMA_g6390.t1 [Chlamydomonas eustigma]
MRASPVKQNSLGGTRVVKVVGHEKTTRKLCVSPVCSMNKNFANSMSGITAGALITGLNTADVQPAGAVVDPTQTLTAIQKKEAEDLYELVRFRMGRNPPTLTSSPNADLRGKDFYIDVRKKAEMDLNEAKLQAEAAVAAQENAVIIDLKTQLERLNQQLQDTMLVAETEKIELEALRVALQQAKEAVLVPAVVFDAVQEVEEFQPVVPLEDVVPVMKVEEVMAVEEATEVMAVKDAEEVTAVKDVDEVMAVKDVDEVMAVKDVDEVMAVKDVDEVMAVKDVEEVKPVEELMMVKVKEVEPEIQPLVASVPINVTALGLLNALGIAVGGGYMYFQGRRFKAEREEFNVALSTEQRRVTELIGQIEVVLAALKTEKEAVADLKIQLQQAATESVMIVAAEKREKRELLNASEENAKALEAERRLVRSVRSQFEAIQEQAEAERAAKLQAIAEAQALSRQLSEAKAFIESGGVMERRGELEDIKSLSHQEKMEEARSLMGAVKGLSATADLHKELKDAWGSLEEQRDLMKKVGGDIVNMKQDMMRMKQQAMDFAMKAQLVSEAARKEKEESDMELHTLNEQLVQARSQVADANSEIARLRQSMSSREAQVASMATDLSHQQNNNSQVMDQVSYYQSQMNMAQRELSSELENSSLREQLQAAKASLSDSQNSLTELSRKLREEEAARSAFQADIAALRKELSIAAAAVESEQRQAAAQKALAEKAEQRAADAAATNAALMAELSETSDAFAVRLADALNKAEAAEVERAKAEEQVEYLRFGLSNTDQLIKQLEGKAFELEGLGNTLKKAAAAEVAAAQNKITELEKMLRAERQAQVASAEAEARLKKEMAVKQEEAEKRVAAAAAELAAERGARSEAESSLRMLQSELLKMKEESQATRHTAQRELEEMFKMIAEVEAKTEATASFVSSAASGTSPQTIKQASKNGVYSPR